MGCRGKWTFYDIHTQPDRLHPSHGGGTPPMPPPSLSFSCNKAKDRNNKMQIGVPSSTSFVFKARHNILPLKIKSKLKQGQSPQQAKGTWGC